jgi:putative transposase
MAHTFTNLLSHIIFSTKDRMPLVDASLKSELYPYMGGIIRGLGGKALKINGPSDHVHILASLPAKIAPAELIGKLKSNSTGWVHKQLDDHRDFCWQTGYAAFSVSHSQCEIMDAYIANQEEHHRKISFKEELVTFLKRHKIEYDEKYLWE